MPAISGYGEGVTKIETFPDLSRTAPHVRIRRKFQPNPGLVLLAVVGQRIARTTNVVSDVVPHTNRIYQMRRKTRVYAPVLVSAAPAKRGRPPRDLTGMRFDRLMAIERAENRGNRPMWLCKCDCGEERITDAASLVKALTRSCGCLRAESVSKAQTTVSVGQVFGSVKIEELSIGAVTVYCSACNSRSTWTRRETTWRKRIGDCGCGKNRRMNRAQAKLYKYRGQLLTLVELVEKYAPAGVTVNAVKHRLRAGWDLKRAIARPAQLRK